MFVCRVHHRWNEYIPLGCEQSVFWFKLKYFPLSVISAWLLSAFISLSNLLWMGRIVRIILVYSTMVKLYRDNIFSLCDAFYIHHQVYIFIYWKDTHSQSQLTIYVFLDMMEHWLSKALFMSSTNIMDDIVHESLLLVRFINTVEPLFCCSRNIHHESQEMTDGFSSLDGILHSVR